jgi:hypothetical protein
MHHSVLLAQRYAEDMAHSRQVWIMYSFFGLLGLLNGVELGALWGGGISARINYIIFGCFCYLQPSGLLCHVLRTGVAV